ncbi:FxsA family protein [Psychromarinibacter sp. C21-152]|uniref:FxsA family protein n=1 Tax=Psychromarinibacter sediminicola TaxID=3033385 RepID=A0AAE3NPS7_9RHOB|nr:FxsA family protein [Psychromarinibacter sediminicola]MDF0601288.1 FxsA family protein [Psychromarinibacter sediminicola]
MWLFALFVAVPLIEIALFIQVGGLIGLWPTLAIVVITALLGTWLVRQQGVRALNDVKRSFNELDDPSEPLAHGAMILFSGALLLTPGFFTDAVGFALLAPPVRAAVYRFIRARVKVQHFEVRGADPARRPPRPGTRGPVIDGDYEDVTPETGRPSRPGNSGWTRH